MNIRETIQKEIEKSGLGQREIGRQAGVEPAIICRFLQGGSMRIETADALLTYFGYELRKRKKGSKNGSA